METLIYVDPLPRGTWALELAALLPATERHALVLVASEEDAAATPGLLEGARERLAAAGSSIRLATHPGPAERAIAQEASTHPCSLLVVPPAGRNALQRMLKGSRVASVVRSVRAPVLVARRPPIQLERILAAVSGRSATLPVITMANRLGRALGARVGHIHVASEIALPHGLHAPQAPQMQEELQRLRVALESEGRAEDLVVRDGLVVDEVLEEFERGAYQLLVIGGQGAEPAPHWMREDLTERLLLGCPGSTLIVPA